MRSNQPFVAAVARDPRARAFHARAKRRRARGARERAVCELSRQRTVDLAAESTIRYRSSPQTARSRAP
eukprot:11206240-Lingulodinium_polyedra.AAC.1